MSELVSFAAALSVAMIVIFLFSIGFADISAVKQAVSGAFATPAIVFGFRVLIKQVC